MAFQCPNCLIEREHEPITKYRKKIKSGTEPKRKNGYFIQKSSFVKHMYTKHKTFYYDANTERYCCPFREHCGFHFSTMEYLWDHIYYNHCELFGIFEIVPNNDEKCEFYGIKSVESQKNNWAKYYTLDNRNYTKKIREKT